jgi:EF-hand domain pair
MRCQRSDKGTAQDFSYFCRRDREYYYAGQPSQSRCTDGQVQYLILFWEIGDMRILTIATLVLASSGGIAAGQTATPADLSVAFAAADQDNNGYVTQEEYVRDFIAAFIAVDANSDEKIATSEMTNPDPERLRRADKNGDGSVTFDEALDLKILEFNGADANNDGRLSLIEVLNYSRRQK